MTADNCSGCSGFIIPSLARTEQYEPVKNLVHLWLLSNQRIGPGKVPVLHWCEVPSVRGRVPCTMNRLGARGTVMARHQRRKNPMRSATPFRLACLVLASCWNLALSDE